MTYITVNKAAEIGLNERVLSLNLHGEKWVFKRIFSVKDMSIIP